MRAYHWRELRKQLKTEKPNSSWTYIREPLIFGEGAYFRRSFRDLRYSFIFQEQSGQSNRAQLFMKFLEAVLEVYGVPSSDEKTHRSGSLASIKPLTLSSSTEDIRAAPSSSLSSSLSSLAGGATGGKNIFIPLPFKRAGSSYRQKKTEKESPKFRRNWSARGQRSTSAGKGVKW